MTFEQDEEHIYEFGKRIYQSTGIISALYFVRKFKLNFDVASKIYHRLMNDEKQDLRKLVQQLLDGDIENE